VTVGLLPRLANAIACHALVNVLSGAWRYSSLYIFELWSVSVSAVDVLADGGITRKCRKPPIVLIFWFYTHPSILANGFSTVYPHPAAILFLGFFSWQVSFL